MLLHSIIIGILLYIFLVYVLGKNVSISENRSVLCTAVLTIYMILFGHGLPTFSINKKL